MVMVDVESARAARYGCFTDCTAPTLLGQHFLIANLRDAKVAEHRLLTFSSALTCVALSTAIRPSAVSC